MYILKGRKLHRQNKSNTLNENEGKVKGGEKMRMGEGRAETVEREY